MRSFVAMLGWTAAALLLLTAQGGTAEPIGESPPSWLDEWSGGVVAEAEATPASACRKGAQKVSFNVNGFCGQWSVGTQSTPVHLRGDHTLCLPKPTGPTPTRFVMEAAQRHPNSVSGRMVFSLADDGILAPVSGPLAVDDGNKTVDLTLVKANIERSGYDHPVIFNAVSGPGDCSPFDEANDANLQRVPEGRWPIGAAGRIIGWVDIDSQGRASDPSGPFGSKSFTIRADGAIILKTAKITITPGARRGLSKTKRITGPEDDRWYLKNVTNNRQGEHTLVLLEGLPYRVHEEYTTNREHPWRTFFFHADDPKADCSISTLAMTVTKGSTQAVCFAQ